MTNRSSRLSLAVALALVVAGIGCSKRVDLEKVPVGTAVEVTRQDGGVVTGTLAARDDTTVKINTGTASRSVPRDQIVSVQLVNETPSVLPALAKFREFTVPAGTMVALRMNSSAGSDSSRVDDPVEATLTHAVARGRHQCPAGGLRPHRFRRGGRLGRQGEGPRLPGDPVPLDRHRGEQRDVPIGARSRDDGARRHEEGRGHDRAPGGRRSDYRRTVGGKKGAGIGAAIGGGGGTAVVLSTRGPQVRLARGAVLSLALDQAVDVRVPIVKR